MVSKITIFEPHFDGAQFGPASIETPTDHDDDSIDHESHGEPESAEEGGSKSRFTKLLQGTIVFVLLFVGLWVVLSRVLGAEEDDE
ncbi:hypothetical protein [Halapricum hydrolyticum]|uniref:Uncharacterized protein n=1 Tax=Halapricum hydrolyticum TaxID=2979991 RepID=A0AAE3LFN9_9EURY|nr:hypothetical protein [Halapricum hydrolyticum]MCU4719022.1 hypothetical protein [Halapricum hydrolyticum]MCU4728011.1 hypothetical protein [Halapricum hydrolyticum]